MNPLIRLKTTTAPFLASLVLVCFGLSPSTQALTPAPDGGYPGANTAEGQDALFSLTTGSYNTAVGWRSLHAVTTGGFNTALGAGTLYANAADGNTAVGTGALLNNSTGIQNTATGALALYSNTIGGSNTADGAYALLANIDGDGNTAMGSSALYSNNDGNGNTGIGAGALFNNTTGDGNTAVGLNALSNATTGSGNIGVGAAAGNNITTANNVICIGTDGQNVNNSCYIGNIWNQAGGSQAVYVNADGKLGFEASSRRFKDEIKPMGRASEVIYGLKPVSFRYKKEIEPSRPLAFGLIAEDVEKVSPDLVTRGSDGRVNSVRYDAVNAMLLNEFLKEHKKVEEQQSEIDKQQATITELNSTVVDEQKDMSILTAQLDQQAEQIQKVAAQIEMSKAGRGTAERIRDGGPVAKIVLNDP